MNHVGLLQDEAVSPTSNRALLLLDLRALDDAFPLGDLAHQQLLQRIGRAALRLDTEIEQLLLHVWHCDDRVDFLVESFDDRGRVPAGAAIPFHELTL